MSPVTWYVNKFRSISQWECLLTVVNPFESGNRQTLSLLETCKLRPSCFSCKWAQLSACVSAVITLSSSRSWLGDQQLSLLACICHGLKAVSVQNPPSECDVLCSQRDACKVGWIDSQLSGSTLAQQTKFNWIQMTCFENEACRHTDTISSIHFRF
jgi:hypothetical protein